MGALIPDKMSHTDGNLNYIRYMNHVIVVVLASDISDSVLNLQRSLDICYQHDMIPMPIVAVIQNKKDLTVAPQTSTQQPSAQAKWVMKRYNVELYFEVSAATGDGVHEAFQAILMACKNTTSRIS